MKELEGSLGLEKASVHYCAFVHDGDKSTHLWMNDFVLRPILAELTGEKQSRAGGGGGGGIGHDKQNHLVLGGDFSPLYDLALIGKIAKRYPS